MSGRRVREAGDIPTGCKTAQFWVRRREIRRTLKGRWFKSRQTDSCRGNESATGSLITCLQSVPRATFADQSRPPFVPQGQTRLLGKEGDSEGGAASPSRAVAAEMQESVKQRREGWNRTFSQVSRRGRRKLRRTGGSHREAGLGPGQSRVREPKTLTK